MRFGTVLRGLRLFGLVLCCALTLGPAGAALPLVHLGTERPPARFDATGRLDVAGTRKALEDAGYSFETTERFVVAYQARDLGLSQLLQGERATQALADVPLGVPLLVSELDDEAESAVRALFLSTVAEPSVDSVYLDKSLRILPIAEASVELVGQGRQIVVRRKIGEFDPATDFVTERAGPVGPEMTAPLLADLGPVAPGPVITGTVVSVLGPPHNQRQAPDLQVEALAWLKTKVSDLADAIDRAQLGALASHVGPLQRSARVGELPADVRRALRDDLVENFAFHGFGTKDEAAVWFETAMIGEAFVSLGISMASSQRSGVVLQFQKTRVSAR